MGNFCKGVKIYHFYSKIILGNIYRHLAIFIWSHWPSGITSESLGRKKYFIRPEHNIYALLSEKKGWKTKNYFKTTFCGWFVKFVYESVCWENIKRINLFKKVSDWFEGMQPGKNRITLFWHLGISTTTLTCWLETTKD